MGFAQLLTTICTPLHHGSGTVGAQATPDRHLSEPPIKSRRKEAVSKAATVFRTITAVACAYEHKTKLHLTLRLLIFQLHACNRKGVMEPLW